jgi:hypothetical protein
MVKIEKAPDALAGDLSAVEINQVQNSTGFETCQDIRTIKEELARLQAILDGKSVCTALEYNNAPVRYWAIRWVMGWEEEIPNE